MWRRLEREIRLLPHVLACSLTQDDVVVLIEPSADPDAVAAAVRGVLEDAGALASIRVLGGTPAAVASVQAGPAPARARAGTLAALLALGALGATALFSGITIDPAPPRDQAVAPVFGPATPGFDRPLRIVVPVEPGAGDPVLPVDPVPPVDPVLPVDPALPVDPGALPVDPGLPDGDGADPPGEIPPAGPDPDPTTPPTTVPPGEEPAARARCSSRTPGRSHVLLIRAASGSDEVKVVLVDPPGLERARRTGHVTHASRGHRTLPSWVVAMLDAAGCDLSWESTLGRAVRRGIPVAVVEPESRGRGNGKKLRPERTDGIGDDPRERGRGRKDKRGRRGR